MGNHKRSSADHVDIHRRLLILTMLFLSLVFAVKTSFYFAGEQLEGVLVIAGKGLAVASLISLCTTIFWKIRFIPGKERYHLFKSMDSFANQMMNQASKISWTLTLILLFITSTLIRKDISPLPAQFYVDLAAFFMLASYSISFLFLFHTGSSKEHQEA